MRKIFVTFLTVFTFFLPALSSSGQEGYYSRSFARLSYVKGDVYIQRASDLGYEEGVVNLPIVAGDMLGTREGRTEIHFSKKNYLRMDYDTQVEIVNLPRRGEDLVKLHLLTGNIYLRINFLESEKSFEIHTPDVSFYILDEGLYRINVRESGETELFVYGGAVEAAGEKGSLLVESEQRLVVSEGHFRTGPTFFYTSLDDDFAEWNEYRDSLLKKRITRTYLPSELSEYEAELANNGWWVYEPPYGYVWVPYVYHYEWRPYFYGRWVWYPIIGWTWVSYESWGWCVYHYGRWHWRRGLGWHWVPTRVWGPAWVSWYWGYDYIGWCPISYYGYPIVIINNIFYGHYYYRYYPYNSRALVVVHKNQLQARHVSKVALKRSQIKRLGKISLSAEKLGVKPVVNRISKNSAAAKALSRSKVRRIGEGYVSGKSLLSPSRLKSSMSKGQTVSKKLLKRSVSKKLSQKSSRLRSLSSLGRTQVLKRTPSKSTIKKYPSRHATSSSQMNSSLFSSRLKKYLSSKSSRPSSRKSPSSRTISLKPRIKTYTSRSSSSSLQSSPEKNFRSYSSKDISSRTHERKSNLKQYRPQSFSYSSKYSSARSRTSSPRYVSSRKSSSYSRSFSSHRSSSPSRSYRAPSRSSIRSKSSSKSYSSRNSRTSQSRSSSRSSSSSLSKGKVKKK